MGRHRQEVLIVLKQREDTLDAERPEDEVDGFPDGDTARAQRACVAGSRDAKPGVEDLHQRKLAHVALEPLRMTVVAGALKDFEEDDVGEQQLAHTQGKLVQGPNRRDIQLSEVCGPD